MTRLNRSKPHLLNQTLLIKSLPIQLAIFCLLAWPTALQATQTKAQGTAAVQVHAPLSVTQVKPLRIYLDHCFENEQQRPQDFNKQGRKYKCFVNIPAKLAPGSPKHRTKTEPAQFKVKGMANQLYQIGIPKRLSYRLKGVNGVSRLVYINKLVAVSQNLGQTGRSGILNREGTDHLIIGAEVTLPARFRWQEPIEVNIPLTITY